MTERGLPTVDGSPACPFVAFEDDRDERSTSPDHRHRCYAEDGPPAPRAAAHQEAYCLSSAFPVCPTFQAWARREAARAKTTEPSDRERDQRTMAGLSGADEWARPRGADDRGDPAADARADVRADANEIQPRRNPPRDWAAPPPWAPGGAAGAAGAASPRGDATDDPEPPIFLGRQPDAAQGLAGSAADRLAAGGLSSPGSRSPSSDPPPPGVADRGPGAPARSTPPDPELAALVGRGGPAGRGDPEGRSAPGSYEEQDVESVLPPRPARRQPVSSTRSDRGREAARAPQREHVQGPSWERARRNEAYPTIRTRAGLGSLPGLPRVAVLFGALIIAAVALFFLPALLGVGGPDDPTATPSPNASVAAPTATPEPTPVPEPTPQTYTIKEGDTLSGIARSFGLTLDELLAANTETIEDPDLIAVGDVIIVPVAPPDDIPDGGASADPTG